jgi:hypothetical protein
VAYPTSMIQFWAGLAELQVRSCIWKRAWLQGVSLYVAHEITLASQNTKASGNGGVPGTSGGVPSSKTVGSVSVGYDSNVTSEKDAGWWNLTNYGKQFYRLVQTFGAGAIQL